MPSSRATLLALAERCEKAEGPHRTLDADIARECGQRGYHGNVTGSIDAAMTLVPNMKVSLAHRSDDCWASVSSESPHIRKNAAARTLPLAICAAALRALAENAT